LELIYLVQMKVGFFDSGVGGITVLHDALQVCQPMHYIYFADTKNVPYGTKSQKEIKTLVLNASNFLIEKNIDILVIACNTATSICIDILREKYNIPIIGMEPAVKPAIHLEENKKILVCATKQTLKQKKLKDLIQNLGASHKIKSLSLQKLVEFAEDEKWSSKKLHQYLKKKFHKINWKEYQAVVLGCTHFLYYRDILRKYIPDQIMIVDGNDGTVKRLQYLVQKNEFKPTKSVKISFYKSKQKSKIKILKQYMKAYGNQTKRSVT